MDDVSDNEAEIMVMVRGTAVCAVRRPSKTGRRARHTSLPALHRAVFGEPSGRMLCIFNDDIMAGMYARLKAEAQEQEQLHTAGTSEVLMIRNLAGYVNRDMLVEFLAKRGVLTVINFLYVPVTLPTRQSVGYAVLSCTSFIASCCCLKRLSSMSPWLHPEGKGLVVERMRSFQSFDDLVLRYRDSPLMQDSVPDEIKPIALVGGVRVPFPPPMATRLTSRQEALFDDTSEALVVKNIPHWVHRDMLLEYLRTVGVLDLIDFAYLPVKLPSFSIIGYAVLGCTSCVAAGRCWERLNGAQPWCDRQNRVLYVERMTSCSCSLELVSRYRDSPIMHDLVPDRFKPVVLDRGERGKFPPPTKKLEAPPKGLTFQRNVSYSSDAQ